MYYNNKKMALSIFWVVLGLVLLVLSMMEVLDNSLYSGMGGGLLAVGILQIYRNFKYRNNGEYRQKVDVEYNDERNRYLRAKAWAITAYIVVIGCGIITVVTMLMGMQTIATTCSYVICALVGIWWIVYFVLNRKE